MEIIKATGTIVQNEAVRLVEAKKDGKLITEPYILFYRCFAIVCRMGGSLYMAIRILDAILMGVGL